MYFENMNNIEVMYEDDILRINDPETIIFENESSFLNIIQVVNNKEILTSIPYNKIYRIRMERDVE